MLAGACLKCGEHGHFFWDCSYRKEVSEAASEPLVQRPRQGSIGTTISRGRGRGQAASSAPNVSRLGSQGQQPYGQARVFAMTRQEASAAPNVITGKIYLYDMEVYVLIDPGSTHSFISSATASHLHQSPGVLCKDLIVRTPVVNM